MSIRKYASVDLRVHRPHVLYNVDDKKAPVQKFGSFSYTPRPGYVYSRVRAISARINKNFDGFPSVELQKAAHTFKGRPVFVNHNNQDIKRTRGVILASQYIGLENDPHISILPEVDAVTFPNLAGDIINGNMDSVSMGCDVDNSTCSYCGNVATTADDFCDHILNNKGQELTKLVNGQPKRILVYEICRGLNFFEISFVFDPADETAVMQEVIVPSGVKMATANNGFYSLTFPTGDHTHSISAPVGSFNFTAGNGRSYTTYTYPEMARTASNTHVAYGEMIAPPPVNTLEPDDNECPQCGSDFNGYECDNCQYITPPKELQDPNTEEAGDVRREDGDDDGQNGDLDYFGEGNQGGDDSADEDEGDYDDDEDEEDEEPNPYDLYDRQPRKEGNVSRGNAVQANVGQALAQRRLAEAQRRLRALAFDDDNDGPTQDGYPIEEEGVDTGENVAGKPPASEAPAFGDDQQQAAPDKSTTLEKLDDEMPVGSFGQRVEIMPPVKDATAGTKRRAEAPTNDGIEEQNLLAPVADMVDERATEGQYSGWANNSPLDGFDRNDTDNPGIMLPDGRGSSPREAAAAKKDEKIILKSASASQVYQLADLYTELGLVPHEQRYAAIAEIEKMPAIVAAHTIKVLGRVKEVFSTTMPQGRVARTASTIPTLGKTASAARTPSMARQAENRRSVSNAEDTLLLF